MLIASIISGIDLWGIKMNNLKITFQLDGTGVIMYPSSPIHLDSLMIWFLAGLKAGPKDQLIERDSVPDDFNLPLKKWHINDSWGWCASALFVEGTFAESTDHWRKRFRQSKGSGICAQNPNLKMGGYREYNSPIPVTLCRKLVAYAVGDRKRVHNIVRGIRRIGHKRNMGYGVVIGRKTEIIDDDFSLVKNGKAQRFLPQKSGRKFIRCRPPYWNNTNKIECCNVGDEYKL